jgi:hypothetical protein
MGFSDTLCRQYYFRRFVMRLSIFVSCAALLFMSGPASAGLFDDLQKMQNQMQQLQQGGGSQVPNIGGSGLNIPSGAMSTGQTSGAGMGNCGGSDKKKLECVCRSTFLEGGQVNKQAVIDSLPKANLAVLGGDISGNLKDLNNNLLRPLDGANSSDDVANLSWYKNAFESPEFAAVFAHFLRTTEKAETLSQIKQVADGKAGFDNKKKAFKRDAQQAYGIILMYYQKLGANASAGLKYLKDAAKGDPSKAFIATYQLGHRAYKGIGEGRNLTKAATWMLKAYQSVQARDDAALSGQTLLQLSPAFSSLVKEEFTSLVSDPNYKRRAQYAELAQQANQMRADLQKSIRDAKGQAPQLAIIERAYLIKLAEVHTSLLKASGNAVRATALEERVLKFKQDRDWSDQDSKDLRVSMPGTDEIMEEVIGGMGAMSAQQEKEFDRSIKELAVLVTDMAKVSTSMIQRFSNGEISMAQMAAYPRVLTSVPDNCEALNVLNGELKKRGKPAAAINDIGENSDVVALKF